MQRSCDRTGGATSFDTAAAREKVGRVSGSAWRAGCDGAAWRFLFLSECDLGGWLAGGGGGDSWVEVNIRVLLMEGAFLGTLRMSKAPEGLAVPVYDQNGLQRRINRPSVHLRPIQTVDRR